MTIADDKMARRAKTKPLPASTNPNWSFQRTRSQAGKGQANILVDLLLLKADDDHPKFEFFPKLPVEIRFKIWGYIEPKPCVIEPKGVGSDMYTTYSRKVPALLQVCRETRAEYLAKPGVIKNHITFTLCHSMSKWPWETAIYVALEHDLVVIHESCIGKYRPNFWSRRILTDWNLSSSALQRSFPPPLPCYGIIIRQKKAFPAPGQFHKIEVNHNIYPASHDPCQPHPPRNRWSLRPQ